ncbi:MarR family winged helix-turn-helix transcriptional regulator [bacterium]|nr:MarR family winged helix-turn-helix transcriptional regulator [bacterium]
MHIVLMRTIQQAPHSRDRAELGFKAAFLIREINARLNSIIASELAQTGLTLPQIMLIKSLAHGKELTITELAAELSTGKSTVVGIVDRLEKAGLVERRRGGEDRREVHIGFAPTAKERLAAIKTTIDATFLKTFECVPLEDFSRFQSTLEVLLESMGATASENAQK